MNGLGRPTVIEIYYYNNTLNGTTKMQHLIDLNDTIERVKQRIITTDNPAAYTVTFQQTPAEASRKLEPEDTLTVGNAGIKEFGILHLRKSLDVWKDTCFYSIIRQFAMFLVARLQVA